MKLKEYLEQPRILTAKIDLLEDKLRTVEIAYMQVSSYAMKLSDASHLESRMDRYLIRKEELENEISALEAKKTVFEAELQYLFTLVEDQNCMEVLISRYIDLEDYEVIAKEKNYSITQIYRFRDKGLKEIEPHYKKLESELEVK